MRTKEEVIKEAWGEYWDKLTPDMQELCLQKNDGGLHQRDLFSLFQDVDLEFFEYYSSISAEEPYRKNGIRPKSLSGIEDNNGWIRIESEEDLPKDCGDYWVYDDDGDIGYYMFNLFEEDFEHVKENGITHYQPIIKPKPPLY